MKYFYYNIILLICASAITIIPLFFDIKKVNKSKGFYKNITRYGKICILIFLIGLCIGIYKEYKFNVESDLKELRLNNPIPNSFQVSFTATINYSDDIIKQIKRIVDLKYPLRGNLLPFDSKISNDGFEKINRFKDIMLVLYIKFLKDGKTLGVTVQRAPLNFLGYNTDDFTNSFSLTFHATRDSNNKIITSAIKFYLYGFVTNDITTNYKAPSIIDFENSIVQIKFEFYVPQKIQIGNFNSEKYGSANRDSVPIELESIFLYDKDFIINIANIKKIGYNRFQGEWIVKKD